MIIYIFETAKWTSFSCYFNSMCKYVHVSVGTDGPEEDFRSSGAGERQAVVG